MIAIWSIVRGIFEILAAIELRKTIDNDWLLVLAGAVSVLFALAHGAMLVVLAFKLRNLHSEGSLPPA